MELKDYWTIAKKWWWLAIACVLVAAASSYIGTMNMPRIYQATTTVMVGQALQQANPSNVDLYISQQLAQTYSEMVKRRPILEGAADALGLEFIPSAGDVSTRQVPSTQLLEISVRDTDPERARVLANEIAYQLILQSPTVSEDQDRQTFVQERLAGLERNIQETEDEIDEEQDKLEAANSARAIQQYQANIGALEQKLSSYESTYASLLLTVQGGTNYISIVEPASTPTNPISPNVPQTIMLSSAIGLALAFGGAAIIEVLDDTLKSAEEAVRLSGDLPMLTAIADIGGKGYREKLITARQPLSPVTEAYRVLRTNVHFASIDHPLKTIMVTSPGPSEGKSVTLANFGVVLAQSGYKVIVVDTDLRRPVQHKIFELPNRHGLSDAIIDPDGTVLEYLQSTQVKNLYVLTAGASPPNPAELLASDRAQQLIDTLRAQADMVLFDSPPALVVTDAVVLGSRVDGVILVNELGTTRRAMARRATEALERSQARLLGFVLNRMSQKYDSGYYYQYHDYYREDQDVEKQESDRSSGNWLPKFLRSSGSGNGDQHDYGDVPETATGTGGSRDR